ncbi:MAG TPA: fumarylacetoacetate hydrolase family protein [Conexibacter sp.]|nr:fumarylacetoacetate hydrolase family protein [Conexibacter sp.]
MRLKRVQVAGDGAGPSAAVERDGRWVALAPLSDEPWARDLVALLAGGAELRARVEQLVAGAEPAPLTDAVLLPFEPRSLRAFSIYPEHVEQSARVLVRRFFPKPAAGAMRAFERVTRRTFPPLKPNAQFLQQPAFYVGNHTAFLADGETMPWPSHTDRLDFELELGFVLAAPVADATPREGEAAIGGFFVVNDWSARDVQADEYRHGMFGPAVKAKSFANSLGAVVVTADELLDRAHDLRGRVRVNGETWSETSTAGAAHSLGALVAAASAGERLGPGDLFATGTLPRGCGLELDRWIRPGDVVELELEGLGTLANPIGARA